MDPIRDINPETAGEDPGHEEQEAKGFLEWIVEHDEKRLFVLGYVGLTLLLTIGISLFWLIFLVSVHFFFEVVKKYYDGAGEPSRILAWAVWDIKFDIALITMALVLVVYTEISFGIAGVAGLGRFTGVMARFSGATRGVLPIKDLILAFRIICTRKMDRRDFLRRKLLWSKQQEEAGIKAIKKIERMRLSAHRYPWQTKWVLTSKLVMGVIIINFLAILFAITFGETPAAEWGAAILRELHPWPPGN